MVLQPLKGKVALVTGGTRGIGRGIALQLGEQGALVYVTGRTLKAKEGSFGSLEDTAAEIKSRGGECIPVQCDHENDAQIFSLFQRIQVEQNGKLDILVNNAYKGVVEIFNNTAKKFWETKPEIWDDINNVGLRNHYLCTVYAARMMVENKQGLIVNISSFGGASYIFNVAYGVGKCAVDRMAVDCGIELKKHNVTMISLYPGPVKTELCTELVNSEKTTQGLEASQLKKFDKTREMFMNGETTEFSGKIIAHLATNPNMIKYTSKVVIGADYAYQFGIKDIDGRTIGSLRQIKYLMQNYLPNSVKFVANFVPGFVKIPQFVIDIFTSKF